MIPLSVFTVTRSTSQAPDNAEPVIDWRQDGACRTEDPALFFPPDGFEGTSARKARENAARRICGECDVFARCEQYALSTRQQHGIWAGQSEDERVRTLRRQRRQTRAGES